RAVACARDYSGSPNRWSAEASRLKRGKYIHMAIKASEISDLIKQSIQNFEAKSEARDVGTIIALTDGICRIHGLNDVQYGEMIELPGNTFGLALNLEQDSVGAV